MQKKKTFLDDQLAFIPSQSPPRRRSLKRILDESVESIDADEATPEAKCSAEDVKLDEEESSPPSACSDESRSSERCTECLCTVFSLISFLLMSSVTNCFRFLTGEKVLIFLIEIYSSSSSPLPTSANWTIIPRENKERFISLDRSFCSSLTQRSCMRLAGEKDEKTKRVRGGVLLFER